ncbi:hypothetical protein Pla163_28890 [Planctomycetes bacterium Pla163]|uniref:Uncharacterized protein n=1 Tax=Rohdeia mirabilis TaxID=2528008 RepID=A0A518D2S9_9BACT|nr:hypothetical protein Pla163_28890 [Planctomycetes bacterium Pla163]
MTVGDTVDNTVGGVDAKVGVGPVHRDGAGSNRVRPGTEQP